MNNKNAKFETIDVLLTNEDFRKRPSMWVGSSRISDFWFFLNGFSLAEKEYTYFMRDFSVWISKRYELSGSGSLAWHHPIMREENLSEEAALDRFFELYDLFASKN